MDIIDTNTKDCLAILVCLLSHQNTTDKLFSIQANHTIFENELVFKCLLISRFQVEGIELIKNYPTRFAFATHYSTKTTGQLSLDNLIFAYVLSFLVFTDLNTAIEVCLRYRNVDTSIVKDMKTWTVVLVQTIEYLVRMTPTTPIIQNLDYEIEWQTVNEGLERYAQAFILQYLIEDYGCRKSVNDAVNFLHSILE